MAEPYQIIVWPFEVWVAPVGEAFPAIDRTPGGNWLLLGTAGAKDYGDDGVTITHQQTIGSFRGAKATGQRKVFRSEEDHMINFTLHDLTIPQYAKVLNDAAISTVAQSSGVAGYRSIDLGMGLRVAQHALLVRGVSAVDDSLTRQYQCYRTYQAENPAVVGSKSQPGGLACSWHVMEDDSNGFGELIDQTTVAGA